MSSEFNDMHASFIILDQNKIIESYLPTKREDSIDDIYNEIKNMKIEIQNLKSEIITLRGINEREKNIFVRSHIPFKFSSTNKNLFPTTMTIPFLSK